jgi:hypothetical protein
VYVVLVLKHNFVFDLGSYEYAKKPKNSLFSFCFCECLVSSN